MKKRDLLILASRLTTQSEVRRILAQVLGTAEGEEAYETQNIIISPKAVPLLKAFKPKGSYQQSLVDGMAQWSGMDLKGKAKEYGAKYAKSRESLITQLRSFLPAEVGMGFVSGKNNRKMFVIVHKEDPQAQEFGSKVKFV